MTSCGAPARACDRPASPAQSSVRSPRWSHPETPPLLTLSPLSLASLARTPIPTNNERTPGKAATTAATRRRPRRCGQRWRETVHALPSQRERQHQELPGRRQALPLRPLPPPPRHCTFKEDMWSKDENGKWGWIGRDICSIPRMPRNPARVARVHDPARPHADRVSERRDSRPRSSRARRDIPYSFVSRRR
jgi:hypothetical protein